MQLEAQKIDELEFLEEELRFRTLKNGFLGRPNKIKAQIELSEQTKKKMYSIEELKEEVKEWEFKIVNLLNC